MSRWRPCRRRVLVSKLRALGFDGPFSGAKHQFMIFGDQRLAIPSNAEYSIPQLRFMMREIEALLGRRILLQEWDRL